MQLQKTAGNEGAEDKRNVATKEQGIRVQKIKEKLLQKAGNEGAEDKRNVATKEQGIREQKTKENNIQKIKI